MIGFRRLEEGDLPLLRDWLARGHVRRWFEPFETYDEVIEYALSPEPTIEAYVMEVDGRPAGFVQAYLYSDHPDYAELAGVGPGAAGIDLLIGEESLVGRGLGPALIGSFVEERIFSRESVTRCTADPDVRNAASIRAFEKAGFHADHDFVDPDDGHTYRLMVLDRG